MNKICSKCKVAKPIDEFGSHKDKKSGLRSQCKSCQKEYRRENAIRTKKYNKKYYKKNAKRINERGKEYRKENVKRYNEMAREHHYLECETKHFQAIESGEKKFVICLDGKDFKKHDMVYLQEVVNGIPTGRTTQPFEIRYVLSGEEHGLSLGYCIFNW